MGGVAGVRRGKLAGLPEGNEVGETVDKLGEGGDDEGVQRRNRRGPKGDPQGEIGGVRTRLRPHRGGDVGEVPDQWLGLYD